MPYSSSFRADEINKSYDDFISTAHVITPAKELEKGKTDITFSLQPYTELTKALDAVKDTTREQVSELFKADRDDAIKQREKSRDLYLALNWNTLGRDNLINEHTKTAKNFAAAVKSALEKEKAALTKVAEKHWDDLSDDDKIKFQRDKTEDAKIQFVRWFVDQVNTRQNDDLAEIKEFTDKSIENIQRRIKQAPMAKQMLAQYFSYIEDNEIKRQKIDEVLCESDGNGDFSNQWLDDLCTPSKTYDHSSLVYIAYTDKKGNQLKYENNNSDAFEKNHVISRGFKLEEKGALANGNKNIQIALNVFVPETYKKHPNSDLHIRVITQQTLCNAYLAAIAMGKRDFDFTTKEVRSLLPPETPVGDLEVMSRIRYELFESVLKNIPEDEKGAKLGNFNLGALSETYQKKFDEFKKNPHGVHAELRKKHLASHMFSSKAPSPITEPLFEAPSIAKESRPKKEAISVKPADDKDLIKSAKPAAEEETKGKPEDTAVLAKDARTHLSSSSAKMLSAAKGSVDVEEPKTSAATTSAPGSKP